MKGLLIAGNGTFVASKFVKPASGGGPPVPHNTAVPYIGIVGAEAYVGASVQFYAGTWTGTPSITRTWEKSSDNFVSDIQTLGAWADNDTPTIDESFIGYKIRLKEYDSVSNGSAYSTATNVIGGYRIYSGGTVNPSEAWISSPASHISYGSRTAYVTPDITDISIVDNLDGDFYFNGLPILTSLSLSSMPNLSSLSINAGSLSTLSINHIKSSVVQSLDLSALTLNTLTLDNCGLASVLPDLSHSYSSLQVLHLNSNSGIVLPPFSNFGDLRNIGVASCGLSNLNFLNDLPNHANLYIIEASSNYLYISPIDLSSFTSLSSINLSYNSLDSAAVDSILVDIVANSVTNGSVGLLGNSPPGVDGWLARNTLLGRGWSVSSETPVVENVGLPYIHNDDDDVPAGYVGESLVFHSGNWTGPTIINRRVQRSSNDFADVEDLGAWVDGSGITIDESYIGYKIRIIEAEQISTTQVNSVENIFVESNDASLSQLRVNDADAMGGTVNFTYGTSSVTFYAVASDSGASVEFWIGSGGSGSLVGPIDPVNGINYNTLSTGDNFFFVKVVAVDGHNYSYYNINVHVLTQGTAEVSQVTFEDAVGEEFHNKYFDLYTANGKVAVAMSAGAGRGEIALVQAYRLLDMPSFATGAEGLYFIAVKDDGQQVCFWFNSGTEIQPSVGDITYREVPVDVNNANTTASYIYNAALTEGFGSSQVLLDQVVSIESTGHGISATDPQVGNYPAGSVSFVRGRVDEMGLPDGYDYIITIPAAAGDNATIIASNSLSPLNSGGIEVTATTGGSQTVTITDNHVGARSDAADVNTGLAISTTYQGVDPV